MLKRKVEDFLKEWKENENHKPLIIKGCRQCGKTYVAKKFAEANYENVVYINFVEDEIYSTLFDGSLSVDNIIMNMSALFGDKAKFVPYKTIIILDEIQECPNARTALKFFNIDGRYDVIATGSLLGVKGYKNNSEVKSISVGYQNTLYMYPLDFEEFLWANGISKDIIEYLHKCLEEATPISAAIHQKMKQLLLEYVVVGGMPEVVQNFVEYHQINKTLSIQKDIVSDYRDDVIKYASIDLKTRILDCFDSIPSQLSKKNKKFQYSVVSKNGTAAKYKDCIGWLEDAGIIRKCYNLNITELPLDGNKEEKVFKIYMQDIGLLTSMLEPGTQFDILNGNLFGYKGAIFENLIADMFSKMDRKLYYFRKDSGLEIDFVTRYKGECVLVEVKARTGNTKSAKTVLNHPEKYHVNKVIKFGDYNIGLNEKILTLPLYMAFMLKEY